jgi:hypothetical protein
MSYFASFMFGKAKLEKEESSLKDFEEHLHYCDYSRLAELGSNLIKEKDFLKAELVYCKLSESSKNSDFFRLCFNLIRLKLSYDNLEFISLLDGSAGKNLDYIIIQVINTAKNLISSKNISKECVSDIERLVDSIPFERINKEKRNDFEKSYITFKEYVFSID